MIYITVITLLLGRSTPRERRDQTKTTSNDASQYYNRNKPKYGANMGSGIGLGVSGYDPLQIEIMKWKAQWQVSCLLSHVLPLVSMVITVIWAPCEMVSRVIMYMPVYVIFYYTSIFGVFVYQAEVDRERLERATKEQK